MLELIGRALGRAARGAVLAVAVTGCDKPLSSAECQSLLGRYTERLVLEETPKATAQDVAHEQEQALRAALRDPRFQFAECPRRVSRRKYDCAMTAPTVDAIEQCMIF